MHNVPTLMSAPMMGKYSLLLITVTIRYKNPAKSFYLRPTTTHYLSFLAACLRRGLIGAPWQLWSCTWVHSSFFNICVYTLFSAHSGSPITGSRLFTSSYDGYSPFTIRFGCMVIVFATSFYPAYYRFIL